ncbi:MAG: DUF3341 domain-containing protein [Betaproteobacteria bacterium]|nr:DUF3341 domain-containing protein [Betaproteobacteria bacterium]MDE2622054.1 DUF3341 domain-containing protein [Betaproteobacteria bacterium]
MSKAHTLALFNDFEAAGRALQELKVSNLPGFRMDDVLIKSPIEHPELSEMLGSRPVYVQLYTLAGAVLGSTIGFTLIASAQGNFLQQIRGGRPIVPIPPDMVLTYELFILIGVLMTVVGCFIAWKLPGNRSPLYNTRISEDKIGILVKADPLVIPKVNGIFERHQPLEIMGEQGR